MVASSGGRDGRGPWQAPWPFLKAASAPERTEFPSVLERAPVRPPYRRVEGQPLEGEGRRTTALKARVLKVLVLGTRS